MYGAHHSLRQGGGVGFHDGPLNQLLSRQRREQSTLLSPLPFKDGTNWLYKRHQRKVLPRVPVTMDSLGGRTENRRVMSVITAGVQTLIRPNGLALITREALHPWKICGNEATRFCFSSKVAIIRLSTTSFLNSHITSAYADWQFRSYHEPRSQQVLSPKPVFLSLTLHPCRHEPLHQTKKPYRKFLSCFHTEYSDCKKMLLDKEGKASQKIKKLRVGSHKAEPHCYIETEVAIWCSQTQHYSYWEETF